VDLHKVFKEISNQLQAEFRKSAEVKHSGGKGDLREDAFRAFLKEYLPGIFGVGRGEVITSENQITAELDIVIYDPSHCPLLIKSSSHSVYPIESVFGAVSVKSHLDSAELKEAYENIATLKQLVIKGSFTLSANPGMAIGMAYPTPVTAVLGYSAHRSLDAIQQQVQQLDAALKDANLRPDIVIVLDQGIVGPPIPLRSNFNEYTLPPDRAELSKLRKHGRHTLLRAYLQLLRELNTIKLPPLELQRYLDMPKFVGPYRVRRHNRFMMRQLNTGTQAVRQLNENAIKKIVKNAKPVPLRQHYLNFLGQIPQGAGGINQPDSTIYEYNPKQLPPILTSKLTQNDERRPQFASPVFQPIYLEIDGNQYAVDVSGFGDEDFDENTDLNIDELLAE
jgi:hypothetical protein